MQPMTNEEVARYVREKKTAHTILDVENQRIVTFDPTGTAVGRAFRAAAAKA